MPVAHEGYPRSSATSLRAIGVIVSIVLALSLPSTATADAGIGIQPGRHITPGQLQILRSMTGSARPQMRPPAAGIRGRHFRNVYLRLPIAGASPYGYLQLSASLSDQGTWVSVATFRYDAESNSDQFFDWESRLPRGTVEIANNLSHISIHTGDGLGAMGSIDLDLSSSDHPLLSAYRCRTSGERLHTRIASHVSMDGTIDLSLGVASIPDPVQAISLRGVAQRVAYTGARCPQERRCYPYAGFAASDQGSLTGVFADRHGMIDVISDEVSWRQITLRWLSRYPYHAEPVTITHDAVTIDGDLATPFLDGIIVFSRAARPKERERGPCRFIDSRFAWDSGDLDVLWDTGSQSLAGPWSRAHTYRWRRP